MPKHFIMVLSCKLITDKIRLFSQCRFIAWISFDVTVSVSYQKVNINSVDQSLLSVIVHPNNHFFPMEKLIPFLQSRSLWHLLKPSRM